METPAITHSVSAQTGYPVSARLDDDRRPVAPEPAQQVDPLGNSGAHPSFPRDAPEGDLLMRVNSSIGMRRRHDHITCSACRVTYLGLSAAGSEQTGVWVCARCAEDAPDGTDLGQPT
jgi:hypothetical protein